MQPIPSLLTLGHALTERTETEWVLLLSQHWTTSWPPPGGLPRLTLMVSWLILCHPAMMPLFSGWKTSSVIYLTAHTEGVRKVLCFHRSNGDVRVFQPSVVWVGIPAPFLDEDPGVGMAAAGSGHAPDRHVQLSLPKLWCGWPSAVQPESPGLCPCCRQCGVHHLPENHWAQVERWVFISEWGPELWEANIGVYLEQKKKSHTKRSHFAVAGVLLRMAWAVEEQRVAKRWCLLLLDWFSWRSPEEEWSCESSCRRAKTLEISPRAEACGPLGPLASSYQLPAKAGKRLHQAETVKRFKILCNLIFKEKSW